MVNTTKSGHWKSEEETEGGIAMHLHVHYLLHGVMVQQTESSSVLSTEKGIGEKGWMDSSTYQQISKSLIRTEGSVC